MKRQFYVTGYVGEGAKRMLLDLEGMDNVELIERVINNRAVRFLYYRCDSMTGNFHKYRFLKYFFYPWFSVLRTCYKKNTENNIVFLNSGFCRELDVTVVDRLKKKEPNVKLILYIVNPMAGFSVAEYSKIIEKMDIVYSINKEDCEKYGFFYYPLVYSKVDVDMQKTDRENTLTSDLYYLGSGADRTDILKQIYRKCEAEGLRTDFHVLGREEGEDQSGGVLTYHKTAVPYSENIKFLLRSNCILEVMHKEFDNPTQRYSEAVAYNKRLLTNNCKATAFDFYDPRYMRIFKSVEDIDIQFLKDGTKADYGYADEFSPRFLIQDIISRLSINGGKSSGTLER